MDFSRRELASFVHSRIIRMYVCNAPALFVEAFVTIERKRSFDHCVVVCQGGSRCEPEHVGTEHYNEPVFLLATWHLLIALSSSLWELHVLRKPFPFPKCRLSRRLPDLVQNILYIILEIWVATKYSNTVTSIYFR